MLESWEDKTIGSTGREVFGRFSRECEQQIKQKRGPESPRPPTLALLQFLNLAKWHHNLSKPNAPNNKKGEKASLKEHEVGEKTSVGHGKSPLLRSAVPTH